MTIYRVVVQLLHHLQWDDDTVVVDLKVRPLAQPLLVRLGVITTEVVILYKWVLFPIGATEASDPTVF